MSESAKWDELGTLGKRGSENGVIIADWEWSGVGRVTVEREGDIAPFSVTMGVYGLCVHTAFCGTRVEAMEKARAIMSDVELLMRSLEEDDDYDVVAWCERLVRAY